MNRTCLFQVLEDLGADPGVAEGSGPISHGDARGYRLSYCKEGLCILAMEIRT